MIEIFEKERYYDDSPYTGHCYMHPTYMRKDGKEAFMFNRREPDDAWRISDNERRKQHLIETDGAYMMFNGYKKDPFEMLDIAARRKHHLVQPNDYLRGDYEKNGFVDFMGNFREVSAAFFYRIYDREMMEKIKTATEHLKKEEWDKVGGNRA